MSEDIRSKTKLPSGSTLRHMLDALAGFGERPAIVALQREGSSVWSYQRLSERIARLATGLLGAGLGRGDPVALLARNRPEWIVACLAVIQAGGVAVPVDSQLREKTLRRVLQDCGSQFVFTAEDELPALQAAGGGMELKPVLLDKDARDPRSWERLLDESSVAFPPAVPHGTATLFYTSGTTGSGKGVPLSHQNLVFQLEAVAETNLVTAQDRVLLPLPLHHVYPFVIGMLVPLAMGLPIIMPQALTGPHVFRAIREERATVVIGVPRLYAALCSGLDARVASGPRLVALLFRASLGASMWLRRRLGVRAGKLLLRRLHRQFGTQLRIMASGGAPLVPELAWKLEALGWQVAVGYGLTETSPLLTLNPPGTPQLGSVGQAIPGVELRIDPAAVQREGAGEAALRGETGPRVGEVLARGPNVFSGYRNLPEKTAQAFTSDGWFRTGDLGFLDEKNYLHLTGRLSSLIVTEGGEKLQPDDVEDAYLQSPVIEEIGVIQKDGNLVALIVPKLTNLRSAGAEAIEQEIREAVRQISLRLPSYQRISNFVLTRDPLARTRIGKIRRHLVAEHYDKAMAARAGRVDAGPMQFEEMSDEDRASLDDAAAKQVWELLAARYPDKGLAPGSSPQLDLGIDSMEWLNLSLEIRERAGVELSEEAIARSATVRDLLREVSEARAAGPKASWLEEPEAAISDKQRRWLKPQGGLTRAAARAVYKLDCALARGLFRLRVKGLENLPRQEPFVLTPNHLSYLDAPVLAAAIGYARMRDTYWGGWTGVLTTTAFTRLLSRLAQVVPIDPDRALFSSLAFGAAVLKRGKNLVWFPEGGVSRNGELQPFKTGIGVLLQHFQALVVPVAIHGTDCALPVGRAVPRRYQVTVEFGTPARPNDLERAGQGNLPAERIVTALHERVLALQRSVRSVDSATSVSVEQEID